MRFTKLFILLFAFCAMGTLSAQRYLTEVFDNVEYAPFPEVYGFNYTVLPLVQPGAHTVAQPLVTQVIKPAGDTETDRPLVIYLKTGNFFPFPQNGSCGGTMFDSTNIEIATRLAKMGYVVAIADYRAGWNPFSPEELVRRYTLINAAYRGIQDVRTCVRYFRKSVAEAGNPHGIDPNKIVIWGQGTGGYLSLGTAFLNDFNEIYTTGDPTKFLLPNPQDPTMPIPMVIEGYNGDIYGTTGPTVVDATYNAISGGAFPIGDTLCIPNHMGYTSNVSMAVNMGGALGDTTWMDPGEIPIISYHVLSDQFAPCETDILNVPTAQGPQPVLEVSGSCTVQQYAQQYGLNGIFGSIPAGWDPMGDHFHPINGGLNGFVPFEGTPDDTSAPWEWTDPTSTTADCNYDAGVARTYIDTIIQYFAPRGCVALNLGCNFVDTKELVNVETGLTISPNPASDFAMFKTHTAFPMLAVELYDMNGRLVRQFNGLNTTSFEVQAGDLPVGMYVAKVSFEEGVVAKKVRFQ